MTRPSRFALSGHSIAIDRRVDAVRRDLAHVDYAGRVFVPSYSLPIRRLVAQRGEVRADVRADSEILSEVLPGESFDVLEVAEHRAWGASCVDGVVGYIDARVLGSVAPQPARAEAAPATGAIAANARALIGAPYRAGGRSADGVDHGGLVFAVVAEAGHRVPRFIDLQQAIGSAVTGEPQPGDLLFLDDRAAIRSTTDTVVFVDPTRGVVEGSLGDFAGAAEVMARRMA